MSVDALKRSVEIAGSQVALAELIRKKHGKGCKVRQGHVWQWLNRADESRAVPAEYVLTIEEVTGVSRHDLRPDLYPRHEAEAA